MEGNNKERELLREIEELKSKIQTLEENNLSLELAETINYISQPTAILDKNHVIIKVNQSLLSYSKKTEIEVIGKSCYEIFHGSGKSCPPHSCPALSLLKTGVNGCSELEIEAFGGFFCGFMHTYL